MFAWHVATVKPFGEFVAEENLAKQGFQPFNPKCRVTRVERGRRVSVDKPYIPGYIFVNFDRDDHDRWPRINNTRGVEHLLPRTSERPTPLPGNIMKLLLDKCSGSGLVEARHVDAELSRLIPVGSRVKIKDGALPGMEGFEVPVTWSHEDRVVVLMSLFGRANEVKLRRDQVEMVS